MDCESSNTYYKISKETLLNLLTARLELNQLEYSGVDNWSWYGEGYQEFMKEEALDYISEGEIPEDIDAKYVAKLMLRDYKEI